jgi:hypothetical protein
MSLLEKAKKINVAVKHVGFNKEEEELALAVLNGEITLTQASKAMGYTSANAAYRILKCLIQMRLSEKI